MFTRDGRGGGIAVYINELINFKRLENIQFTETEAVFNGNKIREKKYHYRSCL